MADARIRRSASRDAIAPAGTAARPTSTARLTSILTLDRLMLALALLIVLAVQAPTLGYFFYNDDYVPFAEIADEGSARYVWNLLWVQDITPNWRVIPGLFYLAGYHAFGMDALPFHVVSIVFHLGTCALLFHIVRRATGAAWAGFAGAIIFGINPTHVFTVGQVTSLNNVQGAFFAVATLAAVIECARAERRRPLFYAAALASFVLAIASNESMAALFPAYGLAFLLFGEKPAGAPPDGGMGLRLFGARVSAPLASFMRAALWTLPLAAIGGGALLSFLACDCNEASTPFFGFDNAVDIAQIYLGRIVYPIGLEPATHVDAPHRAAAIALVAVMALVALRGPALARVGAAFLVLALVPYVAVEVFTAQRYTYQATAGFAMLVPALIVEAHRRLLRTAARAAALVALPLAALLIGWYAWQTNEQEAPFEEQTELWRQLVSDVERAFPEVAPGSTVVIVGGYYTDPIYQFNVMPSIAHLTWNSRVRMFKVPYDSPAAADELAQRLPNRYVARYEGDTLIVVYTPEDIP